MSVEPFYGMFGKQIPSSIPEKTIAKLLDMQWRLNQFYLTKDPKCFTVEDISKHWTEEEAWQVQVRSGAWSLDAAVIEELGELAASLGLVWYRPHTIDANNAYIELIDLLHFMLSWGCVQGYRGNQLKHVPVDFMFWHPTLATCLRKRATDFGFPQQASKLLEEPGLAGWQRLACIVHRHIEENSSRPVRSIPTEDTTEFYNHAYDSFRTFMVGLFAIYALKYELNKFRVQNGYLEGKYTKRLQVARKNGLVSMEDNALVTELFCDTVGYDSLSQFIRCNNVGNFDHFHSVIRDKVIPMFNGIYIVAMELAK